MDKAELLRQARKQNCRVCLQEPMRDHTTFQIGGPAACLIQPPDSRTAAALLRGAAEGGIPVSVIGKGSNLLVSDAGLDVVVLCLNDGSRNPVQHDETTVYSDAGVSLAKLCRFARDRGLSGLEPLYGIPGTVGGAVYMNAGAYGGEVRDTLDKVCLCDRQGTVQTVPAESLSLRYRYSRMMETGEMVLSAAFSLTPDDPAAIGARMEAFAARRREKQPLEYASAGSFFKRPEGHYAGALIEACGLKGCQVGDAQISEKHAGFLINRGKATCRDVLTLMRKVQATVEEQTGVKLEPEVQLWGEP